MGTIFLPARGDTFVYQYCPHRNYSHRRHLVAGQDYNRSLGYILLNFALQSALPANASITSAQLLLAVYNVQEPNSQVDYKVCRILSDWHCATVTWCTLPQFESDPLLVFPSPNSGILSMDLTTTAQKWFSGECAEKGVLIGSAGSTRGAYFQAYSSNASNSDHWPKLKVEYTLPETVVTPATFFNHHSELLVPAAETTHLTHDVSLTRIMTVMITNSGPGTVSAHLEISADGINYVHSSAPRLIGPLATDRLVADVFARYLRVVIRNTTHTDDAHLDVHFQGQIG